MDNRSNAIAGWILAATIVVMGSGIVSGMLFAPHPPEQAGYEIAGAAVSESAKPKESLASLLAKADIDKGAKLFVRCVACHTIAAGGANGVGPALYGIMGKPHAGVAGFAYSKILQKMAGQEGGREVWSFAAMDAWLASPRKYAPGTKMSFAGLSKATDRANILAYLNAQGSNLALPPVPEGAVPEGEKDSAIAPQGDSETAQ